MLKLTRPQRIALKRVYRRDQERLTETYAADVRPQYRTYREIRAALEPLIGGGGCVMLPWRGMWLGIEPDGYTHS